MNAVSRAIHLVGLSSLASQCGVTYQAVRKWERGRIPAERCLDIERVTKGRVTRSDLRPDLWPPMTTAPREAA